MEHQAVNCCVFLLYWLPLVKTNLKLNTKISASDLPDPDLVGRVEHSDLPPDAATGQDVGILVAKLQGGPGYKLE